MVIFFILKNALKTKPKTHTNPQNITIVSRVRDRANTLIVSAAPRKTTIKDLQSAEALGAVDLGVFWVSQGPEVSKAI